MFAGFQHAAGWECKLSQTGGLSGREAKLGLDFFFKGKFFFFFFFSPPQRFILSRDSRTRAIHME